MTDAEIGEAIIHEIASGAMVSPDEEEGEILIWAPNSAEQLGAFVRELLGR